VLYFLAPKFLHRSYKLRERELVPSLKKRENGVLLEMLILKVENIFFLVFHLCLGGPSAFSFIGSSRGRGVLRWCLRGEGAAVTAEVAVATYPGKGGHSRGVAVMSVMGR
jgi:hypothetical protein